MGQRLKDGWPGVVFGLIFVTCGLAAAYGTAGKMIFGYIESIGWQEVPAKIQYVKLVRSYGDTTTYSVESKYSYKFNGAGYDSDRVSLSTGRDNFGSYWQDLERTLRASQYRNEALAFVNPDDPTESLLDRTFRWESVIFGLVFLTIFGGIGGCVSWFSLRKPKSRAVRLQQEQSKGIDSDQKAGSWFLAAFGGVFFVMGAGLTLIILPDAIRKGQYGALSVLLFAFAGAALMFHAFRLNRAYRRFGATPLLLDPAIPGVGGQLGGRFSINIPGIGQTIGSATHLRARLTCTRKSKSGDSTSYSVKWQEETPVYLKQTANGVDAAFLFEIPDNCIPSKEWSQSSSIEWNVTVEGEFSSAGQGKFERNWEVVVEASAAQASNVLTIPQSFLQKAKLKSDELTKTSALAQVPLTEDAQYIGVHSRAGRHVVSKLTGVLFGAIFAGAGIFTIMQNWWPGYLFLLIGSVVAFISLFILGKSIEVVIDKNSRVLHTRESWFGFVYARLQGDLFDPYQFKIKKTSSSTTHNKVTEYYAINFESNGSKIRIADAIEGKKEALALKDAIVARSFNEEQQASAA